MEFGILLVSEVFGVEVFKYSSEQERDAGAVSICRGIEEAEDDIDRDIAFVTDGDIRHIGTWDGEEWEALDLPEVSAPAAA
ncbi:hypothetical protein G6L37_35215 [Agrobacterium rubi]|nr:hypothetical protein [Agrobacterium rubi]NTF23821.1 hypothetical protein [Agrobacterium rubi]